MITKFKLYLENNNTENLYFVYCFVDTRKPGKYIYDDYEFDYEPIYIGKGKGIRPQRHFILYKNSNTRFYNKLKSIILNNYKPEIIYLNKDLTEQEAFKQEVYFIKLIGRIENGGTLTNLTDGGDGQSGFKFSDESKEKMSLNKIGEKNPMHGIHHNEDTKLKISLSKKGHVSWNKGLSGIYSEETLKKMSDKGKLRIGEKNPMFGKTHRKESIDKMKLKHSKKFGEENPNFGRIYSEDEKTYDTWKLTNINGKIKIVNNLKKFCDDNGLVYNTLKDLDPNSKRPRKSPYKEWIKLEKLTDNVKKKKSS